MADLAIQRVTTRKQKKQFLNFPWELYRGDPNWIPPLRDNQKEMVGYTAIIHFTPGIRYKRFLPLVAVRYAGG